MCASLMLAKLVARVNQGEVRRLTTLPCSQSMIGRDADFGTDMASDGPLA